MTEELSLVHRDLGRVEGKLDALLGRLDTALSDHESRIRSLERSKWSIAGAASAVGALGGAGLQIFLEFMVK